MVEKLLPFLDLESTKQLAKAHELTLLILGKAFIWNKLAKRTFPVDENFDLVEEEDTFLASEKSKAGILVELLGMIKGAQQPQLKEDLVHAIVDRFPAEPVEQIWKQKPFVEVSCSCLETHQVSSWGFLILVDLEAKLGSEELRSVLRVAAADLKEPLLSALSQRALLQEEKVKEVRLTKVSCNNQEGAEAWAVLVEQSQTVVGGPSLLQIIVEEEIGAGGWSAIRRAVELGPRWGGSRRSSCTILSGRDATGSGKKEDMMAIWEIISNWSVKGRNGRYVDFDTYAWHAKRWIRVPTH